MDKETISLLRRNYTKIFILFGCDVCAVFIPMLFEGPRLILLAFSISHCFLLVWIGLLLHWISNVKELQNKYTLIQYWVVAVLAIFVQSFFLMLLWIIAAMIMKKELPVYPTELSKLIEGEAHGGRAEATLQRRRQVPGSIWPLYVAVIFVVGSLALAIVMLVFDPSEFGALGMFFVAIFITPFFLLVPGLLRIPAAEEVKKSIIFAQYLVYFMVCISWLIFFMRTSV